MADEFGKREALSGEAVQPAELDLDVRQQELRITWGDGARTAFPAVMLRKNCPCATCRTEREKQRKATLPILSQTSSGPVTMTGGHLVGSYALQVEWSDGHSTGIYDFRLLRAMHEEGGQKGE